MAEGKATRSTALQPLLWALAAFISLLIGAIMAKAAAWLLVTLVAFVGVLLLALLGAFFYFAARQPDALRSEKFLIRKMEIEQSSIGDSERGLLADPTTRRVLSVVPPTQEGVDA